MLSIPERTAAASISHLPVAMTKDPDNRRNGFIWARSLKLQIIMAGKTRQQELEEAESHMASAIREQKYE